MKRKLNENNVPQETSQAKKTKIDSAEVSFDSLNLAPQLLQAVISQKYSTPTPVQAKVIPAVSAGKDVLARSKTGSGKTAAYVLPILQSILSTKSSLTSVEKATTVLILVPTRELAGQVTKVVKLFTSHCAKDVSVENLTRKEDDKVQRARLASLPDIIVSTPKPVAVHVNAGSLGLDKLTHVVVDEADLVLTYGYENDLETISKARPKGCQAILTSATLKEEVTALKKLFCTNPVIISMDEEEKEDGKISQYIVKCAEEEKFLLAYAIFVLKLIKGKTIIFVGEIDRCYRLKLFLEQFGVKSCVLNSELPVNSRIHVVEEFNRNVYDIIIATDENEVIGSEHMKKEKELKKTWKDKKVEERKQRLADEENPIVTEEDINHDLNETNGDEKHPNGTEKEQDNTVITTNGNSPKDEAEPETGNTNTKKKRKTTTKTDKDYGVARGIDFQNVSCVLNFDLPPTSKSYTHRIGRTARAGKTGMALSFVIPTDQFRKHKWTSIPSTEHDEEVLSKITKQQEKLGHKIEPYAFDMKKLDGFRYRLSDALKSVTPGAIRESRVRELRNELIKSEKLKRHFEENPVELRHLRHDGELRPAKVKPHMKNVPDYLLPGTAKNGLEKEIGFVRLNKPVEERRKKRGVFKKKPGGGRKVNPLQSFKGKGKK